MNVEEAITALEGIREKTDGELIRSGDWRTLVGGVIAIGDALQKQVTAIQEAVTALQATTDQHASDLSDLQDRITALEASDEEQATTLTRLAPLGDLYRVTLETQQVHYALGQSAEITATVRTLEGAVPDPLPWVDLFCSWGRLQSVGGFNVRAGAGDRALSVQVNAQGIARVRVRADHAADLSESEDQQVADMLDATVEGEDRTVGQIILETATPEDARARKAMAVMTHSYERSGAHPFRKWADAYYRRDGITRDRHGVYRGYWRNYRTTVIASVKNDIDPRTPDFSRGTASIQVDFRDWIGSWIGGFLDDIVVEAGDIAGAFGAQVTDDYEVSIGGIRDVVADWMTDKGIIGRQKIFYAAERALDQVHVPDPPPFMVKMTDAVKGAVATQRKMDVLEFAGGREEPVRGGVALNVLVGQSAEVGGMSGKVDAAESGVMAVTADVAGVKESVTTLGLEMENTRQVGQAIQVSLSDIENKVVAIDPLNQDTLQGTLAQINAHIGEIKSNVGNF